VRWQQLQWQRELGLAQVAAAEILAEEAADSQTEMKLECLQDELAQQQSRTHAYLSRLAREDRLLG